MKTTGVMVILWVFLVAGCSGNSKGTDDDGSGTVCLVGTGGCACTPGGVCDPELRCVDGVCNPDDDDADTSDTDEQPDTAVDTDEQPDTGRDTGGLGDCLEGSYSVTNELDRMLFHNYTCVTGNLVVHAPELVNLLLPSLREIGGHLVIRQNAHLENLLLGQLSVIGGDLVVEENPSLTALDLHRLESVGNNIRVQDNAAMIDLDLPLLSQVIGDVRISTNVLLPQCSTCGVLAHLEDFAGFFYSRNNLSDDCSLDCADCDGGDVSCYLACWECARNTICRLEVDACETDDHCAALHTCRNDQCIAPGLTGVEWDACIADCETVHAEGVPLFDTYQDCMFCLGCPLSCARDASDRC